MLAMMLDEPKYGYQLKREAAWITGQGELHNNLVYPMLRSFLEKGWVSKKEVAGQRGQTRQQYALSALGRKTLLDRLSRFSEDDASSEGAFHLRVGLFLALEPEVRNEILDRRDNYLLRRDQKLKALLANIEVGKFGGEIIRHMRKKIELELAWVRHLRRLAKSESNERKIKR